MELRSLSKIVYQLYLTSSQIALAQLTLPSSLPPSLQVRCSFCRMECYRNPPLYSELWMSIYRRRENPDAWQLYKSCSISKEMAWLEQCSPSNGFLKEKEPIGWMPFVTIPMNDLDLIHQVIIQWLIPHSFDRLNLKGDQFLLPTRNGDGDMSSFSLNLL